MDITLFSIGSVSLIVGIILIIRNRFYKHKSSDMLFVAELKIFLGGLILVGIGLAILINEIKKVMS